MSAIFYFKFMASDCHWLVTNDAMWLDSLWLGGTLVWSRLPCGGDNGEIGGPLV